MNPRYKDVHGDFFITKHIEGTPFQHDGGKTLSVVGLQNIDTIISGATSYNCNSVCIGAKQSFTFSDYADWDKWEAIINHLLENNIRVIFEFKDNDWQHIQDSAMFESQLLYPVVSVNMSYISVLNRYNTTIKIDEPTFGKSNNGTWCHNLSTLLSTHALTRWDEYKDNC